MKTTDGYDSGEIINQLLNLVRISFDVEVLKHNTLNEWICSVTFKKDGEPFTIACKNHSYQQSFLDLLYTINNWKTTGKIPENVRLSGEHPYKTIGNIPLICNHDEEI